MDLLHQWSILHLEDHGSGMEKEERLLEKERKIYKISMDEKLTWMEKQDKSRTKKEKDEKKRNK